MKNTLPLIKRLDSVLEKMYETLPFNIWFPAEKRLNQLIVTMKIDDDEYASEEKFIAALEKFGNRPTPAV
jgi:Ca2+-binding EF-hand superfamily protein